MNNCIVVQYTPNGMVAVATQTSSTANSSIEGVSCFIEGTVGFEMHKHLVA